MERSVALLRAVNVGTTNRVRMETLRAVFHEAGYVDATTHIQTGNVIFTPTDDEATTRAKIEAAITRDLGLTVVALLRTARELSAVLTHNPLLAATQDLTQLYVGFLASEPAPPDVDALNALSFGDDRCAVVGREIYVQYAVRASETKLTAALLEKRLRQRITMRNWAVTSKLAELSR
jgi:uncharacterized protein (DUF1697 family)